MLPGYKTIKTSTFLMCFFLFSTIAFPQKFGFRNYGAEYGIPDGFVNTINQSEDGFLWIGTGNGIARFDGYKYYRVSYPDSVESRNPYVSYRDHQGTIWFGCNDGTVFFTKGRTLEKLNLQNTRSISQILQGPDSLLYIIPQGGSLFTLNISKPESTRQFQIPEEHTIFSAAFNNKGQLIAGTQGKILILRTDTDTILVENIIDEDLDYAVVRSICPAGDNNYLIGTEDNGLFILNGHTVSRINGYPEFTTLNVKSIFADSGNKIWVSTSFSGVIQFRIDDNGGVNSLHRYNTSTGLSSDDVQLVFRDFEDNYWFGQFGNGLSMLVSYAFGYYSPGKNDQENDIIYVKDSGENYFLGTPKGYHIFDADNGTSLSFTSTGSIMGNVSALSYFLEGRRLWIGTNGMGLYVKDLNGPAQLFFRSGDSGKDEIRDVQVDESRVWIATTNGLLILDKASGTMIKSFGSGDGLPVNFINKILLVNGEAYIGTETDRFYKIGQDLNLIAAGCRMTGSTKNRIVAFSRDMNDRIWTATEGNGTFACLNDSVVTKTRINGLFSNYCYSILSDSKNNIWIGHEKGLSFIDGESGIVKSYGAEYVQGGKCNPGGIFESSDGKIFIGTTSGVLIYNSIEDNRQNNPPYNNITSITIDDREYEYAPSISLPYKKYRVTINYSGINFSDPEKVYYSTYLENFDSDWSTMTTDRKTSYNLSDGKYRFHLVSVDENGISQEPGISFVIQIARPVYKKWWFITSVILIVAGIVFLIIRQREKAHKKLKEYLEDELEKRTSLIIKQKGEIELQNLEITDSINYAKRIQSSILPDVGKLKENFREAFILFHPRDIVSGDFYWFDKVDEERFIVVCADSTGHGVPGAFMSMIGSTLLQDIVTRKKITRPSQVLSLLDKQIFSTLNQNVDLGVSNDGMDMVVCEFNLRTRHIRFASAMRPLIIVLSGESFYIKGNRSSVGGESVIDKYFDDQEYYLNEGDTIYLFSDGLPDQFGGIDGKKMKIARLKKLIDQIIKLPMCEQEKSIIEFYSEWKGGYEQVDDILMMGIRV